MGFTRVVEDFACAHCGRRVRGDGWTNHCPACLHSRHVDVDPGDRAADCGGLMEPVAVEPARTGYVLTHRCLTCGAERRCRTSSADDVDAVLAVARRRADEVTREPRR